MDPKEINFAAMPQTAVNVVTKPTEFFQGMPKTGGFLEPLVFAIIMGFIGGIIQALLNVIGFGPAAGYGGSMMTGFGVIIFMPIFIAIGSFIGGAILFVIWKLMGSREDYETAYRCGAYLSALAPITSIIGAVPYLGGIISMAIYVLYLVIASVHVHNLPSQKSWLVFGIIGAIFAILGVSGEYKARHMSSEMEKWLHTGEAMRKEYQDKTKDMQKSADEMREQAEKMAEQFRRQAEEVKRQSERNR
ncbi:MAG: YIP1 family protein [Smithella sp.]|nr:YIP1 family protein [Smithella sp.]HOU51207.1 YIP1 family protein [Smithella sp.]HQG65827.1 YIP1 family protein [Smithella sp.]HQH16121.1 YIP1 family protein [Smithella sp.]HQI72492.1 YIP1 family protein [Smithella sp.]